MGVILGYIFMFGFLIASIVSYIMSNLILGTVFIILALFGFIAAIVAGEGFKEGLKSVSALFGMIIFIVLTVFIVPFYMSYIHEAVYYFVILLGLASECVLCLLATKHGFLVGKKKKEIIQNIYDLATMIIIVIVPLACGYKLFRYNSKIFFSFQNSLLNSWILLGFSLVIIIGGIIICKLPFWKDDSDFLINKEIKSFLRTQKSCIVVQKVKNLTDVSFTEAEENDYLFWSSGKYTFIRPLLIYLLVLIGIEFLIVFLAEMNDLYVACIRVNFAVLLYGIIFRVFCNKLTKKCHKEIFADKDKVQKFIDENPEVQYYLNGFWSENTPLLVNCGIEVVSDYSFNKENVKEIEEELKKEIPEFKAFYWQKNSLLKPYEVCIVNKGKELARFNLVECEEGYLSETIEEILKTKTKQEFKTEIKNEFLSRSKEVLLKNKEVFKE